MNSYMRKLSFYLIFLSITCGAVIRTASQPNFSHGYNKSRLQRLYSDILARAGYRPVVDKSGNLQFNRDGITYLIMGDEENLNAVSIVMPNIASISDEDDRIRVLRAADVANARTWGTRIFTFADSVHVCSDLFVDSPDELAAYLEKVIMCLRFSSDQFFSALNELNSTDIQGVYGVTSDQSEAEEFELPTEMVTPGENPLQEESEDLTELMGVPQPGAHPENLMQMLRSMGMIRDMHCPVCGTDYEWIVGIIKPGRRPGECPNCRWAPQ